MNTRVNFIRGISSHHVLDCQFPSRVEFDPGVKPQHFGVEDDNKLAIGNHALYFPSGQLIVLAFGPNRDGRIVHWRWINGTEYKRVKQN